MKKIKEFPGYYINKKGDIYSLMAKGNQKKPVKKSQQIFEWCRQENDFEKCQLTLTSFI